MSSCRTVLKQQANVDNSYDEKFANWLAQVSTALTGFASILLFPSVGVSITM